MSSSDRLGGHADESRDQAILFVFGALLCSYSRFFFEKTCRHASRDLSIRFPHLPTTFSYEVISNKVSSRRVNTVKNLKSCNPRSNFSDLARNVAKYATGVANDPHLQLLL